MREIDCSPRPSALIESMRNVGYTMEAAVADILDNSIAAQANEIRIFHDCEDGIPSLAILDNGCGMTEEELIEAMRPGGLFGPLEERQPSDLGRFGLGLKTASFSQCRKVTVVTKSTDKDISAACWDLDKIQKKWSLLLLSKDEAAKIPWVDYLPENHGTLVLWEKMDRIAGSDTSSDHIRSLFLGNIELVKNHLSIVFHRFLEEAGEGKISLTINNIPVRSFDPYFRKYTTTQRLEEEVIQIRGEQVSVKAFIIPHYSKLKQTDLDTLKELGGPAATQGFYVYRNKRLLAWGDWFRLRKAKTEASGLARVMVDIPNALDDLWNLDIKKSSVSPPDAVKRELMRIIDRITDSSTRTYTSRGHRMATQKYSPWQREVANSGVTYHLDRNNAVIFAFYYSLPSEMQQNFNVIIDIIERFLPVEAIHNDKLGGALFTEAFSMDVESGNALVCMLRAQGVPEDEIKNIMDKLNS